ncbi:MAG: hypothetical protein GEV09_12360 [Pseudonocardiaceae bacterium]|nr:hypothetical protein [Pseudonocardiaceae bacterium]
MAGHRRTRSAAPGAAAVPPVPARAEGQSGPTQRAGRRDRRREHFARRYAQAATPAARLEAAHDYLRGAAARRQPNPARAGQLLDDLARQLLAAGDQLLTWQARERTNPTGRKDI